MTTGPLHIAEAYGLLTTIPVYLLIGFAFGFILERGGFGDSRIIVGVLYLRDFRVPKVMFTAILTIMVGAYFLGAMRVLDLSELSLSPTWIWPQLVGGLIFGFGFVVGGFCPGTALVGAANRKLDAVAFIAGVPAGIFAFALAFDFLKDFFNSSAMGKLTLPGLLGIHPAWILLAASLFAFFFFGFGNRMEAFWAEQEKKRGGS